MQNRPRPSHLPSFERPPLSEVVVGMQFATLENMQTVHAGLLWSRVRDQYPGVTEHSALPPIFETYGIPDVGQQRFRVEALTVPPFPRFWFESADGVHLMQFQRDRLLHNWRQRPDQNYPQFEDIRDRFECDIERLSGFLENNGLGPIRANQCEVTYINTIPAEEGLDPHASLHSISPLWSPPPTSEHVSFEHVSIESSFILNTDGTPYARLHLNARPVRMAADLSPALQLELTARGRPTGESVAAVLALVDRLRIDIVETFAAVTTPEMHRLWGRLDAS